MTHPCITSTMNTLAQLRDAKVTGVVESGVQFSPEVYFSADATQGKATFTLNTPKDGGLLDVELKVTGSPEWLSLNIGLGRGMFSVGEIFGIMSDLRGATAFGIQPFIRSDMDGTINDTPLSDSLEIRVKTQLSALLHPITREDPVTYGTGFHTLVMPLPKQNLSFELRNLGFFHLAATPEMGTPGATLGAIAV